MTRLVSEHGIIVSADFRLAPTPLPDGRGLAPAFTIDERRDRDFPSLLTFAEVGAFEGAPDEIAPRLFDLRSRAGGLLGGVRAVIDERQRLERDAKLSPVARRAALAPRVADGLERVKRVEQAIAEARAVQDRLVVAMSAPNDSPAQAARDAESRAAWAQLPEAERPGMLRALCDATDAASTEAVRALLGGPLLWQRRFAPELVGDGSVAEAARHRAFPNEYAVSAWHGWALGILERLTGEVGSWLRAVQAGLGGGDIAT